ncbi:MAG: hypothetical protein JWN86_1675 [Planctomycetota bacterium]|nr:hypothetical protein [Planctomycetota bacterium]
MDGRPEAPDPRQVAAGRLNGRNLGRSGLKTTEAIVRHLEAAKGKYAEGPCSTTGSCQVPTAASC